MTKKFRLSGKLRFAFGCTILALLVVGSISYRGMVDSSVSDRWVRHTQEVLENIQDLLAAMQTAESNVRGYLLTGDDSFLEGYRTGIVKTEREQLIVRNLTVDNPSQQCRLDALASLAAQTFQLTEKVFRLRRTSGLEASTKGGRNVLEEIKESSALKTIPVVILTISASENDILGSYQLHANCHITKPVDLDSFLKVVKSIESFWLSVVKLPREALT